MPGDDQLRVEAYVEGARGNAPRLDVRFDVPPGITVLFGPSGAGKSTCLAAIAGLVRPSHGQITLGSDDFFNSTQGVDLPPHRRRVALVFQSLALFPHLSVEANVAYGAPRLLGAAERRRQARAWLERMHVRHVAERRPATLSGGEAQRVALARALASAPQVLLLDEPFSALDERLRDELIAELVQLVREHPIPTLLVTHNQDDVHTFRSRVVMLSNGRTGANAGRTGVMPP